MKKIIFSLVALLAAVSLFGEENIKFKGWKQAETEHFRFIYEDASKESAVEFAKIADDAWNKVAKIYGCPPDKLDVTVTARTNTVNAYTMFAPVSMGMFNTPLTNPTFTYRDDWKKTLFTHELIHAANIQFEDHKTTETMKLIFGQAMSTLNQPEKGWALEGLTTVLETELTEGGRGRSPYFELEYKAPTIDNAFMSYEDIGKEAEPPYGQAYVMGYLMMRSIADQYGIKALADIERNRDFMGSWEQAVELVTGKTCLELYTDVRIALAKKYADERKIPEGIIISPREVGTSYYKPAYIDEEGNIIALRTSMHKTTDVVKLTPSAKRGTAYVQDIKPEEDLNTVFNETVLFKAQFADKECITAAKDGTVYGVLSDIRQDRMPGRQMENFLYRWTKDEGLTKLTKKADIFHPTVSADGKTLVAIEQNHMRMRIVKIDLQTGDITTILEEEGIDFLEPALNADGSKLAFMKVDWKRGAVCVLDMNNISDGYKVIYNGEGKITDPSAPNWNADGNLTFTDNARGRLESFEVTYENGEQKVTPVVADPIGVLWTYKNSKGIFYMSHSSTGDVIKIKPLTEWGVVPQAVGPSPAGEKICFGHLTNDYPEYVPYEIPSQKLISEEEHKAEEESKKSKLSAKKSDDENKEPVAIKGKYVKQREEEFVKKAEEANSIQTELTEEKKYLAFPIRILSTPIILPFDMGGKTIVGFGAAAAFTSPMLQLSLGLGVTGFAYYPKLNNFDFEFMYDFLIGNSEITTFLIRENESGKNNGTYSYQEATTAGFYNITPLYSRTSNTKQIIFNEVSGVYASLTRKSSSPISLTSDVPYKFSITQDLGFEFSYATVDYKQNKNKFLFNVIETGFFDTQRKHFYAGVEAELSHTYVLKDSFGIETGIFGRYMNYPSTVILNNTFTSYPGEKINCLYPGAVLGHLGIILPPVIDGIDTKVFYETRGIFGFNNIDGNTPVNNTPLNFQFPDAGVLGLEYSIALGTGSIGLGVTVPADFSDLSKYKIYSSFKLGSFKKR